MKDVKGRSCKVSTYKPRPKSIVIGTISAIVTYGQSDNNINKVGIEVFEKQRADYIQRQVAYSRIRS